MVRTSGQTSAAGRTRGRLRRFPDDVRTTANATRAHAYALVYPTRRLGRGQSRPQPPTGHTSDMVEEAADPVASRADEDAERSDRTAGYRVVDQAESVAGNRFWWDVDAERYHAEHGAFLGAADLVWGPEGLPESDARLLGEVAGLDVLEVGCGGGQGARWAAAAGARVVGVDLSAGMLAQGRRIEEGLRRGSGPAGAAPGPVGAAGCPALPAYVQADACALPFADGCFDLASRRTAPSRSSRTPPR